VSRVKEVVIVGITEIYNPASKVIVIDVYYINRMVAKILTHRANSFKSDKTIRHRSGFVAPILTGILSPEK